MEEARAAATRAVEQRWLCGWWRRAASASPVPALARDLRLLRGEDAPRFLTSVGPLGDSRSIHILRWMHGRQLCRDLQASH